MSTLQLNSPLEQFSVYTQDIQSSTAAIMLSSASMTALIMTTGIWISLTNNRLQAHISPTTLIATLLNGTRTLSTGLINMAGIERPQLQVNALQLLLTILLTLNMSGLMPYSFAFTSQLWTTLLLSLTINLYIILRALTRQQVYFMNNFLPADIPAPLVPLLITIETISYILKILTLAIRLFANMTAGHILLAIVAGFATMAYTSGQLILLALAITLTALICILCLLETGVALVQGIVFTLLTTIYIADSDQAH